MCVCVATGWQRQIARQEIDNKSRKSTSERTSASEGVCVLGWDYEKSREEKLSKRNEIIIKKSVGGE